MFIAIAHIFRSGATLLLLAACLTTAPVAGAVAQCLPGDLEGLTVGRALLSNDAPSAPFADELPSETDYDEEEAVASDKRHTTPRAFRRLASGGDQGTPASGAPPDEPFPERA